MLKGLGRVSLISWAAWIGHGCILPGSQECICDSSFHWKEAVILDAQAKPIDSAAIAVVRTADGKPLKTPNQSYAGKGKAVIFDDGIVGEFPAGKPEMEIRVTASKGGKSGEELFVVTTTECRCHFEVKSGRDTVEIR